MSKQGRTPGEPEIIEPKVIPDVFVTGLLPAEDMGDFVRITGYSDQRLSGTDEVFRVIVMRCVWPKAAYLAAREVVDAGIRTNRVLTLIK